MTFTAKLKVVFSNAATRILVGGVTVGVAIFAAMQDEQIDCPQWRKTAQEFNQANDKHTFFVAIRSDVEIPKAYGDRVIGDCAAGICTIANDGCPITSPDIEEMHYHYKLSVAVDIGGNNWRLFKVTSNLYTLEAIHNWASNTAGVQFFGSFGDVVSKCLQLTTAGKCTTLLSDVSDCWLRVDGSVCRYGLLYGPGEGGQNTCSPGAGDKPMPCTVDRGAGDELVQVSNTWTCVDDQCTLPEVSP